jgi:hypothetical protein
MRNNFPIVPDAVSDALRTWGAESHRVCNVVPFKTTTYLLFTNTMI